MSPNASDICCQAGAAALECPHHLAPNMTNVGAPIACLRLSSSTVMCLTSPYVGGIGAGCGKTGATVRGGGRRAKRRRVLQLSKFMLSTTRLIYYSTQYTENRAGLSRIVGQTSAKCKSPKRPDQRLTRFQ